MVVILSKHHLSAAHLPIVLKVRSFEQRLIIKELYCVQQEIRKNSIWLESYMRDPMHELAQVAKKIESKISNLKMNEKDCLRRLDSDSKQTLRKVTGSYFYN